ncbi:spore coat protein GerQ [Piscibacillus salipiscarius]|uniref:spore coat protein GerQ n=1 Tax=Piscibacillus salipiscarius TaxID=299480 RepID=UPI0006D0AD13
MINWINQKAKAESYRIKKSFNDPKNLMGGQGKWPGKNPKWSGGSGKKLSLPGKGQMGNKLQGMGGGPSKGQNPNKFGMGQSQGQMPGMVQGMQQGQTMQGMPGMGGQQMMPGMGQMMQNGGMQGGPMMQNGGQGPVQVPIGGGPIGRERSYIENILRLNRGKEARVYMTFEGQDTQDVFTGTIEEAGRDHIVLADSDSGKWYLLLMIYLDYVEFNEEIEYQYPFG